MEVLWLRGVVVYLFNLELFELRWYAHYKVPSQLSSVRRAPWRIRNYVCRCHIAAPPPPPCDCHFKAWKFIYCIMGKVLHFSHDLPPSPRRPCSSPSPSCAIQLAAFHLMQRPKDVRKQGGRIQDSGSRDPLAKSGASSAKLFCPNPVGFFSPPNSNSKSTLCRGNGSKVYGHVRLFGARKSGGKSGNSTGVGRSLALPLHLFIFLHSVLFRCAQDVWYTGTSSRRRSPSNFLSQWVRKVSSREAGAEAEAED